MKLSSQVNELSTMRFRLQQLAHTAPPEREIVLMEAVTKITLAMNYVGSELASTTSIVYSGTTQSERD